jgi:tape measure domain-containing protein
MPQFTINFSNNASATIQDLDRVVRAVSRVERIGQNVSLNLDTSTLSRQINATFNNLNRQIENAQRRLNRLQIGSSAFRSTQASIGYREGQRERGDLIGQSLRLRGQAQSFEGGSLVRLEKELRALQIEASQIRPNSPEWALFQRQIGQIQTELKKADQAAESIQLRESLGAFAPNSLNQLQARLKLLRNEANQIAPDTTRWRQLNREIQQIERGIERVNRKPLTMGQRAGAAGGAFLYGGGMGGGVGSAVGGVAGGLAGGVPGAFAGAAIGQVVDNLGQSLAAITSQASKVQQLQRGLALASIDAKDFAEAQAAVADTSARLFIPIEQVTKSFAQLRVNTKQYGLSVEETKKILEGTILAVSAVGGSAEDVDGAMRAVVQILSKGSVQAEELRGQLGERFPGAVVKFAQANKLSFEELQKGLEQGTIGIKEFVAFAEKNYEDYAEFSEKLATAPEFAGRRLQTALEQLGVEFGSLFGGVGANIQDTLTGAIKSVTKFIKDNKAYIKQFIDDWGSIIGPIAKVFVELLKVLGSFAFEVSKVFTSLFQQIKSAVGMASIGSAKARLDKAKAATEGKTRPTPARADSFVDIITGRTVLRETKDLLGIKSEFEELDAAQRQFNSLGGMAAYNQANQQTKASDFTYGGPGAGMSMERTGAADKEKKAKQDNLEAFERLRDQLADAYNRAEIERIKQRYELEKRLRDDLLDRQEFGANRLQRQNLDFLRALIKADDERTESIMNARLAVAEAAGRVEQGSSAKMGSGAASGSISIVEFGKALQKMGFTVKEHPAFGGVGRHSKGSYHYSGEALDITDWRSGDWKGRTKQLGEALRSSGAATEIFHPGYDPVGGHDTHLHAAFKGGQVPLTPGMQSLLGGRIGAGAPRKVGSNESRDTLAAAKTGLAENTAAFAEQDAAVIKSSALLRELARYQQEAYGLPDLTLDNQLLKARNDLIEQGIDENVIDYRMRLVELDLQQQDLLSRLPEAMKKAGYTTEERASAEAVLAAAFEKAREAEKAKNDETQRGVEIQKRIEVGKRIETLKNEISALQAITDAEKRLRELRAEGLSAEDAQVIFDLEKIKQNLEETRALIGDFVSQTSSDYKGFLKAVISGEDAVDALKQFQEGLKDKVLTVFFDFAMKPVENYFNEQLRGLFGVDGGDQLQQLKDSKTIQSNIDTNVNAIAGKLASTQSQVTMAPGGFPVAAPGGTIASMAESMLNGPALPFDPIAIQQADTALAGFNDQLKNVNLSTYGATEAATNLNKNFQTQGNVWQQSLGKAVSALGIAAGSVMGIAAGIGQIKEGGTSNILGGVGSLLMSAGGFLGGFGSLFGFANGGVARGGIGPIKPFANGGTVSGPTLGLIGEGKYNEAIVPLPDGRSIPVQMRGNQQSSRDLLADQRQQQMMMPNLSMSFQTSTINGVEYVSRDQLEAAMAATRRQAARDGAQRGMDMTLDKIQNSPSTRSRIGVR